MTEVRISGLFVYPVKSLRGIALQRATLGPKGLQHDRRFMVVRPDGRFVTQRELPALCRVATRLLEDAVELSAEDRGSFRLPFAAADEAAVRTRIWEDDIEALDLGDAAANWLTAAAASDQPLRIVRMAPGFRRQLAQGERFGEETTTVFADSAPYLVANEASLADLNRELEAAGRHTLPMNRFRPNIVLEGAAAFAEHRAARLQGDGWSLTMVDHCVRCIVTTVDQQTADRDRSGDPLRTLRRINPAPGPRGAPAFAENATLQSGAGAVIAVGDTARLAGSKPPPQG